MDEKTSKKKMTQLDPKLSVRLFWIIGFLDTILLFRFRIFLICFLVYSAYVLFRSQYLFHCAMFDALKNTFKKMYLEMVFTFKFILTVLVTDLSQLKEWTFAMMAEVHSELNQQHVVIDFGKCPYQRDMPTLDNITLSSKSLDFSIELRDQNVVIVRSRIDQNSFWAMTVAEAEVLKYKYNKFIAKMIKTANPKDKVSIIEWTKLKDLFWDKTRGMDVDPTPLYNLMRIKMEQVENYFGTLKKQNTHCCRREMNDLLRMGISGALTHRKSCEPCQMVQNVSKTKEERKEEPTTWRKRNIDIENCTSNS